MPGDDGLDTYRAKRTGGSTPEPMAPTAGTGRGPRMFVIHQHDATRMHWDLRLEIDGVLCSWAAPKAVRSDMSGPTLLGLIGAEMTGGGPKRYVLPDERLGTTVDDATKQRVVNQFMKG